MTFSIFIITRNEAERLPLVLEAVSGLTDDVVVVDSGSSDDTVAVAEAHGARVFHRDWTGYGPQKRFAEDQCVHDWLLNLDADEQPTPGLAGELKALFETPPDVSSAYKIRILNVYPGDRRPRPFANDYNVVRLYNRTVARYRDDPVFDRVVLPADAQVKQLSSPLYHHSIISWFHMVDKANRFSSHELDRTAAKPRAYLLVRIVTEMPLQFLRNYFLRGHIFGGWKGFVFALNTGFLRMLRVAKALELKENRDR